MLFSIPATFSSLIGRTGPVDGRTGKIRLPGFVTAGGRTPAAAVRAGSGQPILVGVVLLGMLVVGTGLLVLAQTQARQALEDRFALRATLGASFVAAYSADVIAREQSIGAALLDARLVEADDFEHVVQIFGFEAAVLLDSDGLLLQVAPAAPHLIGTDPTQNSEHLRQAVAGVPTVSTAVSSAAEGRPIVGFAAPFDTVHGRRVFSGGYHLGDTPLAAYLDTAIPFVTASAYLIDANGMIVDSNTGDDAKLRPLASASPALAAAIEETGKGTYQIGLIGQRFAVEGVDGTSLRLILSVPTAQLYAPLDGPTQWVPWVLLASLGIGAFYLLRVHSALARTQARLQATGQELERSNRDLKDFASVASHDLQEPLRKIQAFGDRLSAKYGDQLGEAGLDYLGRMTAAAHRMRGLIEDLLSYSRVAARAQPIQQVALGPLVDEVLTDLERRIDETAARVTVESLPVLEADALQMRQIFQNLIANAIKFVPPETTPEIRIWAEHASSTPHAGVSRADPGSVWRIFVADNGIGFDQQYLDRIFAPFQRLHGRSEYEGTGMGLAICRRIAERHGGEITAQSDVGKGSTFIVTLPERQPHQPEQHTR